MHRVGQGDAVWHIAPLAHDLVGLRGDLVLVGVVPIHFG